ncbi:hypothetical protein V6N13_122626 [Hibiscus sabdariffa]
MSIKILLVGIHIGQLQYVLNLSETEAEVIELHNKFRGQTVMLRVEDMDIFKGISLKLLAIEQLFMQHTENTEAIGILNNLCRCPKNVAFLVSGKDKKTKTEWFSSCEKLEIAALG